MAIKILTIDDSKMVRLLISRAFKKNGCQVFEASHGVEGIAMAIREKPDLILLDVTMPVMNGVEVLAALKSNEDLKLIPVVMLTAEGSQHSIAELAKMGVSDHIVKPFKEQDIIDRVGRILPLTPAPPPGGS